MLIGSEPFLEKSCGVAEACVCILCIGGEGILRKPDTIIMA